MMGFGSMTLFAHAQTVGSDQATLQQQLELMKAKLQLLQLQEVQAGGAPTTDNAPAAVPAATPAPVQAQVEVQPAATISAPDAAALNAALSSLATTLVSLQSAMQQNPQFLTENGP